MGVLDLNVSDEIYRFSKGFVESLSVGNRGVSVDTRERWVVLMKSSTSILIVLILGVISLVVI